MLKRWLPFAGVLVALGLFYFKPAFSAEGHTEEASTRETQGFAEYDTLMTKFKAWVEKTSLGDTQYKVDGSSLLVQPSKSVFEKSAELLKRIKWYRGKIAETCVASDPSAKALGEFLDTCLAPGLFSEAVNGVTKVDTGFELKFDYLKLYTCKTYLSDFLKKKREIVGESARANFALDWELELKLSEFFDLYIGKTNAPKSEEKPNVIIIDELGKVSVSNLCLITEKTDTIKEQVKPSVQSQQPQYQNQNYDNGYNYQNGYGAGGYSGSGYGGGYDAGKYKYDPGQYKFDPNLYKFDPNRYKYDPRQDYDGGNYTPPLYFPQGNYNKQPNYQPSKPQYFPPPRPSVEREPIQPVMPQQPYPRQQPQYPFLPPFMPPPTPITPYLGGLGVGVKFDSEPTYRPIVTVTRTPSVDFSLLGLWPGMNSCQPKIMGQRCQPPRGCCQPQRGFGVPNINRTNPMFPPSGSGMLPGMSPGLPVGMPPGLGLRPYPMNYWGNLSSPSFR